MVEDDLTEHIGRELEGWKDGMEGREGNEGG